MDVKQDVKNQKKKVEETKVQSDFFTKRDKTSRGTDGLIEDAANTLTAEFQVKEMLYEASLKEIALPETFEPMFNSVILTAKRNKLTSNSGMFLPTSSFGEEGSTDLEQDFSSVQKVMAVGPQVQQVNVGMTVQVNLENFKFRAEGLKAEVKKEFVYRMPVVVINDVEYIQVSERDIKFILVNGRKS